MFSKAFDQKEASPPRLRLDTLTARPLSLQVSFNELITTAFLVPLRAARWSHLAPQALYEVAGQGTDARQLPESVAFNQSLMN